MRSAYEPSDPSDECVQFLLEIRKNGRCGSRSPDNAEFDHFTLLFCRARQLKKFTKNYNALARPLFCSLNLFLGDVLVAVASVFNVKGPY